MRALTSWLILLALLLLQTQGIAQTAPVAGAGGALTFDGVSQFIKSTDNAFISTASAATIEVWYKTTSAAAIQELLIRTGMEIRMAAGHIEGHALLGTWQVATDPSATNDGRWHHAAVSASGSNGSLIVDGQLVASLAGTAPFGTSPATIIAGYHTTGGYYFAGMLDEIRIWDVAIDVTTIDDWRGRTVTNTHPFNGHLLDQYHFDDGAGTTAVDSSGSIPLSLNNGPTWTKRTSYLVVPQDGSLSTALYASDADSDALVFSISAAPANGAATITNASSGAVTVTPSIGFIGSDTLAYKANDGTADSNIADAVLTVIPAATPSLSPNGTATGQNPIPFTITFSQSVTSFSSSGVTVLNGTVASLTGAGSTYTLNVIPASAGAVKVTVLDGSAIGSNGYRNTMASAIVTSTVSSTTGGSSSGTAGSPPTGNAKNSACGLGGQGILGVFVLALFIRRERRHGVIR